MSGGHASSERSHTTIRSAEKGKTTFVTRTAAGVWRLLQSKFGDLIHWANKANRLNWTIKLAAKAAFTVPAERVVLWSRIQTSRCELIEYFLFASWRC
jgi:hypothetical protein